MRTFCKILVILLCVYIAASLIATAVVNLSNDKQLVSDIVNNRYGLLVSFIDSECIAILSPFTNYCDIFILVIDWEDGLRLYTDGFDFFGYWD